MQICASTDGEPAPKVRVYEALPTPFQARHGSHTRARSADPAPLAVKVLLST